MKKIIITISFFISIYCLRAQDTIVQPKDSLLFTGQVSLFFHNNFNTPENLLTGIRYIPEINYYLNLKNRKRFSGESSFNLKAQLEFPEYDTLIPGYNFDFHRIIIRYETKKLELRAGLQKLNFGSAMMLRPLMWFDSTDPRDPLQLTGGVWALAGKYYLRNNTNIWLWGLYGNDSLRASEYAITMPRTPEFGTRIQFPCLKGEAGLSAHYRQAQLNMATDTISSPEWRIGIDGKWDIGPGIWIEATWAQITENPGILANREMITAGTDYTFPIGNGLLVRTEQMIMAFDENPWKLEQKYFLGAFSLSYPLDLYDQLSIMTYLDYQNKDTYNFVTWRHNFKSIDMFLMAYLNPKNSILPVQNTGNSIAFGGPGFLIMFVYHHAKK